MSQNNFSIPIGKLEPDSYGKSLHAAISQLKLLVFERRELSLSDDQSYALHVLSDLQQRIMEQK